MDVPLPEGLHFRENDACVFLYTYMLANPRSYKTNRNILELEKYPSNREMSRHHDDPRLQEKGFSCLFRIERCPTIVVLVDDLYHLQVNT